MKRVIKAFSALLLVLTLIIGAAADSCALEPEEGQTVFVTKIEGLPENFITGADISSLLSLEAAGRVFYGFDGRRQDLLKTLSESGVNYIRVRVWNDPFDSNGNGYGGGNCTLETATELGRRAAEYGMGLLVDFHYSDFWADPGKQQAPKAWQSMTLEEKTSAIYSYTAGSISAIEESGVEIGMVQVGNETTNGLCGETDRERRYTLMRAAAQAVRDTDESILIAAHFTNPEKKEYSGFARDLQTYGVDYDIFSTSFYPEYHGTVYNLKEQLAAVHEISGKKVMIAETAWAYSSTIIGAYKRSVQGQADEIADCVRAMSELGDYAVGVFYWEPAWIDVPGKTEEERVEKRELYGAGWASSYSVEYDPDDAGLYYGATACVPTSLFDPDGHPLESLKTFRYVRQGSGYQPQNLLADPSFEDGAASWSVNELNSGTVGVSDDPYDAREGSRSLHFWSDKRVSFTAEQTVTGLTEGKYSFSLSAQGGDIGSNASLKIYAVSGGTRYEQSFTPDGWRNWKTPLLENIPCGGELTVGVEVSAPAGAWGSIDCAQLFREPSVYKRGDADGDGAVTIIDATAVQKYLANYDLPAAFNPAAADVNSDGAISVDDVTEIQRFLAYYDDPYHIGEPVRV